MFNSDWLWFDRAVPDVRQIVEESTKRLANAGVDSPRLNAELLLAHVLDLSRGALRAMSDRPLTPEELRAFEALTKRRLSREPIDYILGEREFYSRSFIVRPGVLIPRPETETIIDIVKAEMTDASGLAADIGCGSGALTVTLAAEFPRLRVLATDISAIALGVTRENAARHRVASRVCRARMDGLSAAAVGFDLIVSNPPYIDPAEADSLQPEVRDYEPPEALFGGPGGLETARRLLKQARERLKPGGLCMFEHAFNQGERMKVLAKEAGFEDVRTERDPSGLDRVLVARAGGGQMMNDFYAVVVVDFAEAVDRTSRAMFAERMAEHDWEPTAPNAWSATFEARSRHGREQSVRNMVQLAAAFARIEAGQFKATVLFSDDEPIGLIG